MGEVYRSRDTKLKRDVAIKVLPAEFSRDPERIQRFRREAEVLATLNHPHIAQIYGLEEAGDMVCLVLELAEGDTLAQRLQRGPLPIDDALEIAIQITRALEAAHERGIVHRDLKPSNIKITPTGQVKVLDFGLAKAMSGANASAVARSHQGMESGQEETSASRSPTMLSGTMQGAIMGTAAYMSPEQAKGRTADVRSDIWAFGCVLFEMLTGKAGFDGETIVEILGEILKAEPNWAALPAATPLGVRSLLKRCLQKDRTRRLYAIADARFQIEEAMNESSIPASSEPVQKTRERIWMGAALVVMLVALSLTAAFYFRGARRDSSEIRLQIVTGPTDEPESFAIAPDGLKVVYRATLAGKPNQLFLRPLNSDTAQPLTGTEGGERPFWSPDSRSIGFFAGGQLKRLDIDNGSVLTLTDAAQWGGTWNADGTILFAKSFTSPLYRIPAGGGEAVEVTRIEAPQQTSHLWPKFLPDGRRFLFYTYGTPEIRGIYVGSLDSKESQRVISTDAFAEFVPPDYVLFHRQGALVAQKLDLKKLTPIGEPVLISKQLAWDFGELTVGLSASASGMLAYRTSDAERQLVWLDRSGQQVGTVGGSDAELGGRALTPSPDGRTVAVLRTIGGNLDIWLMDTTLGVPHPFTLDPNWNCCPVWSPDGTRIAFSSDPKGPGDIFEKPTDGSKPQTLLWSSTDDKNLMDWSRDGRYILTRVATKKTGRDLWVLPLEGDKKPFAVAETSAEETLGRFSPDGHWIALQSNDTKRNEIYVQPFPGSGGKRQITNSGGENPKWGRDSGELFYIAPDDKLMAVPITPKGSTVEAGKPVALFTLPSLSDYEVTRDGQRILINKVVKDPAPITVVLNWKPPK
jgi:serine/threonine protein kinase/Tol biopolymer transport system component